MVVEFGSFVIGGHVVTLGSTPLIPPHNGMAGYGQRWKKVLSAASRAMGVGVTHGHKLPPPASRATGVGVTLGHELPPPVWEDVMDTLQWK